ncbi:MAG: PQQ-dependent sugar dehydrogenase [Bacteroidota bacterium]
MYVRKTLLLSILVIGICTSCDRDSLLDVPPSPFPMDNTTFSVETIAKGFSIPFGIAIVSDSEYFITDRTNRLYWFKDDQLIEIDGTPNIATFRDPGIAAIAHGGLMDISLHPEYPNTPWLYIAYLSAGATGTVARFQIHDNQITQLETILETSTPGFYGNGMRIVWEDDSHFFLNIGASTLTTNANPILISQDLNEDWGKVHRLMEDGSTPADNPIFAGTTNASSIWSYGHRDVQGLYYDKVTGTLFGVEHGPKGGDEFNVIEGGNNYGWPLFTFGINYDGATVSSMSEREAAQSTQLPEHYWTAPTNDGGQSIAPSCLLKVDGSSVPDWNDHFLIGSLAFRRLLKFDRNTGETFGLDLEGRVRTIKQLPGGDIIALIERSHPTLSNGRIVRISAR